MWYDVQDVGSRAKYIPEGLIAAAVLAAACLVFFHNAVSQAFIFRDIVTFSFPKFSMLYKSMTEGRILLWNNCEFLGFPFMADPQAAVFYPLHLLIFRLDFTVAFKVLIIMHYYLSGLFFYIMLRQFRLAFPASLFGATAFLGSGYLMSMNGSLNVLLSIPWLPATAACLCRAMDRKSIGWCAAGGAALAMPVMVGSLDTALMAATVLVLFVIISPAGRQEPSGGKSWVYLLFLFAAGGFIAAIQLLPSLELGAISRKVAGYSYEEASRWSLHPYRLVEFIMPWFYGKVWPHNHFWGGFFLRSFEIPGRFTVNMNWALSIYPGIVVLVLAAAGSFKDLNGKKTFLIVSFVLFLFLALGRYSPLFLLAYHFVPLIESMRYPEKYMLGATFGLCALSAFGFESLIAMKDNGQVRRNIIISLCLFSCLALICIMMFAAGSSVSGAIQEWLKSEGLPAFSPAAIGNGIFRSALWPALVCLVFMLILFAAKRYHFLRRIIGMAVFATCFVDLVYANGAAVVWGDSLIYKEPPLAAVALKEIAGEEQGKNRIYRDQEFQFKGRRDLPEDVPYLEKIIRFTRDTLMPNVPEPEGLEQFGGYNSAQTFWFLEFANIPAPRQILNISNVRYLLTGFSPTLLSRVMPFKEIHRDELGRFRILENRSAFPRAFFVNGVIHAADDADALEKMRSLEAEKNVLVVDPDGEDAPGRIMVPAEIKDYLPEKVSLIVDAPTEGYLVLCDSYYPGWKAEVNGREARILRADYLIRAVKVEAGKSEVDFHYLPYSFRAGGFFSLASLLWLVVAVPALNRRKRRRQG